MQQKGMRLPIAIELLLLVGGLFFVTLAVSEYESSQSEKDLALSVAKTSVKHTALMYFDSLNLLMLTGAMDERERLHKKLINTENILEARVIRGEPVINQFGPGFDNEKPLDEMDRKALNGEPILKVSTRVFPNGESGRVVTVITPFHATKNTRGVNCLECHNVPDGAVNGAIRLTYSIADTDVKINQAIQERLVHAIIFFIVGMIIFSIALKRRLILPLLEVGAVAKRITEKDLDFTVKSSRNNELGDLMINMESMRSSIQEAVKDEADKQQKERDSFAQTAVLQAKEEELIHQFETQIDEVVQAVKEASDNVSGATNTLSGSSETLMKQNTIAEIGVSTTFEQVQTTASATEEISANISLVNEQVEKTLVISNEAVKDAKDTNSIISDLADVSREIGSVIATIREIADQTNLLALNASIEAARAGDAGRGFSVVAGEVKELANQTASATESIAQKITRMQNESESAVDAIQKIGQTIVDLNSYSQQVSSAMEEQTSAIIEISSGAQKSSESMDSVKGAVADVQQAAERTDTVSNELNEAAAMLNSSIIDQERVIKTFLSGLEKLRNS